MDKKENQKEGNGKFENFSEELGARLSQLREQKGWTQEDMAEKIGKCPQTVYRYEYGLTEVPAKILSKYAKLFQVSADFLFYGDNAEVVSKTQVRDFIQNFQRELLKIFS